MEKLVTVIMGQNADRYIEMCYNSVKDSDAIVFCDGGSTDGTISYLKSKGFKYSPTDIDRSIIFQDYKQLDKKMNGRQRNYYLDYVKKKYPNYWCLCIDVDEVVEDLSKVKEFIQLHSQDLYSVKMRHLISDLMHEDYTKEKHFVPNRLFKIKAAGYYPETEHPVLQQINGTQMGYTTDCTTIWHLAYCPNIFDIKKRYDSHKLKSEMHTPEYLIQWRNAHLFGTYPKKQLNPIELPRVILDNFGIDKDELYFNGRNLEVKHGIMVKQWNEFFKPKSVVDIGCGRGPYLYHWETVTKCKGYEPSEYAVKNKICNCKVDNYKLGYSETVEKSDLITVIDVLEHLEYERLDWSIDSLISSMNKYLLISLPYKGTPNCEADSTHIIKESRKWWVKQFISKGLKEVEVPNHFLFKEQLLIFQK